MAPALHEVKLTKMQRKQVTEVKEKLPKMLQTPVSQSYSSSDSSSVIILGKLPSSQKKSSTLEHKSAAGESESESESAGESESIMSIGSFGEELNKLRKRIAEREKREKERESGGAGGREGGGGNKDGKRGGGEGVSSSHSTNIDPELFKAMKDAMNMGVAGPSTSPTTPSKKRAAASGHKATCLTHGKTASGAGGAAKGSKEREREPDYEQKSESNNNSNKKSIGSTKNETSCSCPSDAEP